MNKRLIILVLSGVILLLLGAAWLQNLTKQATTSQTTPETTTSTPQPVAASASPVAVSVPEGVQFDPVYSDEDIQFWHPELWKSSTSDCGEFGCSISFKDTNNVEVLVVNKMRNNNPETNQPYTVTQYVETFMSPEKIIKEQSTNDLTLHFLRDDNRIFVFSLPAQRKIVLMNFTASTDRSVINAVIESLSTS